MISLLRKERHRLNFRSYGKCARFLQQGHGLWPGAGPQQHQADSRRPYLLQGYQVPAHRYLSSDEGKDICQAKDIGHKQDQKNYDNRAHKRADNTLTGRKGIDTPGELTDFNIR